MSLTFATITYESIATTSMADIGDGNLVISKPSGLAVGDLMIAGAAATINNHSAWASNDGMTELFDSASNNHGLAVYSKIATSADVAASTFTFTPTNGSTSNIAGGFIIRLSGAGGVAFTTSATNTTITSLAPGTITPTFANSMFLLISSEGNNNPDVKTVSAQSMATSNPTWTERFDNGATGAGSGSNIAVATSAVRPETTATGAFNVTFNNTTDRAYAVALCISPKISGSDTPDISATAYSFTPIQSAKLNAVSEDPTSGTTLKTTWANEDKPTTTWVNEDK